MKVVDLRLLVHTRAGGRCEYCRLPQNYCEVTHHLEHIVARQHGGSSTEANLALACHRCNLQKGPNLAGIDPATNRICELFHPRRDRWVVHFRLVGPMIEGITPSGRATVRVLALNDARRLEFREELILLGLFG